MLGWLNIALGGIAAALTAPALVVCAQCLAALLPPRRRSASHTRPAVAVLIPAHNEEAGLAATLATITPQLREDDRLLVVADNCTDATAQIARRSGAEALERTDAIQRGKGYALDAGVRRLESGSPPPVLIIIDADCEVGAGTINALASQVAATGRPAQAVYLMSPPADATGAAAVSALAFLVKNQVRPRGLSRLGLPCLLTGTGMAFPWDAIRQAKLASGNIVEDMQLGLDLAMAGNYPEFCETARVVGQLPTKTKAALTQRTRWEHGHLRTLITQSPRLLWAGLRRADARLFALGLELAVPPLSLLVMTLSLSAAVMGMLAWNLASVAWWPVYILAAGLGLLLACLLLAWARFGRRSLPASALLTAPLYLLWKIPLYFAFIGRREKKWVRTERDPIPAPPAPGDIPHHGRV